MAGDPRDPNGPPADGSVAGWLQGLTRSADPVAEAPMLVDAPPAALAEIDFTPLEAAGIMEGESFAEPYFRELLRGVRELGGGGRGLAELAHNVRRYVEFSRTKLASVYQALRPKDRATFSIIPYALHSNVPGLPGYDPSDRAAYGISNFEINATVRLAVDEVFPARAGRSQGVPKPVIRSLLAMGSVGTIGHSGKSDIDYWVVIDRAELGAETVERLRHRVDAVEQWARKRGLDAHFFLVDADAARADDFGGAEGDVESSGTAQGKLLKEEFYRTAVYVSGQIPLWWVAPVGTDAEGYGRLALAVSQASLVSTIAFVDLGFVDVIDRGEFFGAALWQINKSLHSPFKSLLKMALLCRYLDEDPPRLLCDQLKARVFSDDGEPQLTDPYVLLFDAISEYFSERGDWEAFRLVQTCFYLKVGLKLSRARIDRSKFVQRFRVMHAYIARWGWEQSLLEDLDALESWSVERVDAMGQRIRTFMLGLYRQLVDRARTATVRINDADITILGRRLFACFGQETGKVHHLFTYFLREPRTEERLMLIESADARAPRWALHRTYRRDLRAMGEPPIWVGETLSQAAAWISFNGLFHKGTVVGLIGAKTRATTAEFRLMLDRFDELFRSPDPFEIPPPQFLAPRQVRSLALALNLDLDRTHPDVAEQAGVFYLPENWDVLNYGRGRRCRLTDVSVTTLNSWGEVFCTRFTGADALVQGIRHAFRTATPGERLEREPEIIALQDRTLPAVRNRLREILAQHGRVLLDPPEDQRARAFIYEIGGRFQIVRQAESGPRFCTARSLRGVCRLLGDVGAGRQSVELDRLSPRLSDLRALAERQSADREPGLVIGWRVTRERGWIGVVDESGRYYQRECPVSEMESTLLLIARRVLHRVRGRVATAAELRRLLRIYELREGRALGAPPLLADDAPRVFSILATARSGRTELWLEGAFAEGRSGLGLRYGDERFHPGTHGRRFIYEAVLRILRDRSHYDHDALFIDGSVATLAPDDRGPDRAVVRQLRLMDTYDRQLTRALAVYRGGRRAIYLSEAGFRGRP